VQLRVIGVDPLPDTADVEISIASEVRSVTEDWEVTTTGDSGPYRIEAGLPLRLNIKDHHAFVNRADGNSISPPCSPGDWLHIRILVPATILGEGAHVVLENWLPEDINRISGVGNVYLSLDPILSPIDA
jgi:hypothetical protein